MAVPIILGVIAVLFMASYVVDRRRRRHQSARLAEEAQRGTGVDGTTSILAADARAVQDGGGMDRFPWTPR